MTRFLSLCLVLFHVISTVPEAQALTTVTRDFDQLVTRAETVFKGSVIDRQSRWVGTGETRHIATFVTFQVEETYKGESSTQQTLEFVGGIVGDEGMTVPDMPQFVVGQRAVLFVVGNGQQFCPLVGIDQGRFHVVKDAATGRDRVFTNDGSPVVKTAEIGKLDSVGAPRLKASAKTGGEAMAADDFRAEILGKIAAAPR